MAFPVANRTRKEIEPLIGFFINTLVIRSNLESAYSFKEVLKNVKETILNAYKNQEVPFEKIVDKVVKGRDFSHSPLFQTVFILQNRESQLETGLNDLEKYLQNF